MKSVLEFLNKAKAELQAQIDSCESERFEYKTAEHAMHVVALTSMKNVMADIDKSISAMEILNDALY